AECNRETHWGPCISVAALTLSERDPGAGPCLSQVVHVRRRDRRQRIAPQAGVEHFTNARTSSRAAPQPIKVRVVVAKPQPHAALSYSSGWGSRGHAGQARASL